MRVALAQINTIVGDIEYNKKKIIESTKFAKENKVDLIVFPELALTGYPPEDLITHRKFVREQIKALESLSEHFNDIIGVVGFVNLENDILYNSACVFHKNQRIVYNKVRLPNYGVFDEERYFGRGKNGVVFSVKDNSNEEVNVGITICEDIWYPEGVLFDEVVEGHSDIIINLSSSPYHIGKANERYEMLKTRARDYGIFIAYTNLVGGQDELVFDGGSAVFSPNGEIVSNAKLFDEEILITDIKVETTARNRVLDNRYKFLTESNYKFYDLKKVQIDYTTKQQNNLLINMVASTQSEEEEIFNALVLGIRDYIKKNNFSKVVVGVSGGIDSAVVSSICVKALGKENVIGVSMPSRFSSEGTKSDARILCQNLGIKFLEIPIEDFFNLFLKNLNPFFEGKGWNITEENIQARIRGLILMALSNKFGWIVVSTGNKSELSMGYSTLYGDMGGGFALIKDLYKTTVYKVAGYINRVMGNVIPESIITRVPTAELRENQKDQDTLPPYELLDIVLKKYIEEEKDYKEIHEETGIDPSLIKKIINTVNKNEYKRRQAPIGVKITKRSFGKDRRYPITNRYFV
jgi:NAD+ synthase (glutamine-hydrolysing)